MRGTKVKPPVPKRWNDCVVAVVRGNLSSECFHVVPRLNLHQEQLPVCFTAGTMIPAENGTICFIIGQQTACAG